MMQELKQKGLARETILAAVTAMDEEALALACAKKKVRQWLRYAGDERKKRVLAFLQRKGFPSDVCLKTARILVNHSQDD
jgi:regulatory protein